MATAGIGATGLALFALSFYTGIYADYAVAALPLVVVTAAAFVQWLQDHASDREFRAVGTTVAALIFVSVLPSTVSFLSDGTRFDYRPAFATITREGKNLPVLTWPLILQDTYAPALRGIELPSSAAGLTGVLQREQDLWAVISVKRFGIAMDDSGEIAAWLYANCRLVDQFQRPRLDYRMHRVDLWRCKLERQQV
jgi:hypothetical protein